MKDALRRMLSSVKVWTAIIGMLATAGASLLARYGLEVSTEAVQQTAATVAGLFAVLLATQGLADAGKEAAKLKAETPTSVSVDIAPPGGREGSSEVRS